MENVPWPGNDHGESHGSAIYYGVRGDSSIREPDIYVLIAYVNDNVDNDDPDWLNAF